jgi:hypothetical protein
MSNEQDAVLSSQNNQNKQQSGDDELVRAMDCFIGTFFQLQLLIYFQATNVHESNHFLPQVLRNSIAEYKVLSMMLLPHLCEKCSPRSLFSERTSSSSSGILRIIGLIMSSTSLILNEETNKVTSSDNETYHGFKFGYDNYDSIHSIFTPAFTENVDPSQNIDVSNSLDVDVESHLSTTSIILSILLAILELGSDNRQEEDEIELAQLVPHLFTLSTLQDLTHGNHETVMGSSYIVLQSEIAEMASYALALINARSSKTSPKSEIGKHSNLSLRDKFLSNLDDIKSQLVSEQPPVRAYSVCELRKLSKSILQQLNESLQSAQHLKISLQDESLEKSTSIFSQEELLGLADDVLALCILSLKDAESYVYLASIQTIVSMADENPRYFVPIIIQSISSGKIIYRRNKSDDLANQLNCEQRVKLVEAMTFIIRRRGQAASNYSMNLLNALLYRNGRIGSTANIEDEKTKKQIQIHTEKYFIGENNNDDCVDEAEDDDERLFRLKTGGPIFDKEENDVIRSACISLVAELLSALHPSSLAGFCPTIVPLAVDALRLDHSRLVRRASAMLSRELYSCALRESNSISVGETEDQNLSFTVALLSNGEDILHSTLKRAYSGDDLDLKTEQVTISAVSGKLRFYDSATIVRCEEALNLRRELVENGTINLAALIMKSNRENQDSFIKRFISTEMRKNNVKSKGIDMKLY